ncbi:hypothetical protein QYM36_003247 [Artemia franciscana]|uniref:Uncharacterized protein n=1 Tax=Artemia franciscana TaxID=6661 RepID=A0AA88LDZ5_ARTSF|nr:hypothetical protein QYM36_003247 [Artemia franciscana]
MSRLQKYRSDMTKPIKVDVSSKPSLVFENIGKFCALPSPSRLALAANTSQQEAQNFLEKQESYTLQRRYLRPKHFRRTIALYFFENAQADLMSLDGSYAKHNAPYKFLLVIIDILKNIYKGFSRRFDIPNPPTHHGLFQLGPQQISPSGKSQKKNDFGRLKNELERYNEKLKKAAKGTSKHLMKKYLTAERFKEAVFEGRVIRTTTNAIRSLKLKLYTMEVVRTAISGVSDKVYIFDDRITTLPLGRYKIEEMN